MEPFGGEIVFTNSKQRQSLVRSSSSVYWSLNLFKIGLENFQHPFLMSSHQYYVLQNFSLKLYRFDDAAEQHALKTLFLIILIYFQNSSCIKVHMRLNP